MASVSARGGKLWCRLKDERGQWVSRPTPYGTDEPGKAQRYADAAQKALDDRRAGTDVAGGAIAAMPTVAAYLARWSAERAAVGIGSAKTDRKRLERHAMSHLGMLRMDEVRPRHIRDMVRALKAAGELAPRSILHVFRALYTMFENALVDELVTVNPVAVKAGELPKKRDKDPEWRSQATYAVREVERLISDPAIPVERRVQHALKALAGLRHGEVAALCWRHYDPTAEPLGRLTIAVAYCSRTRRIKATKTEETRAVPVHPVLAKVLAEWKQSHWERVYGRSPGLDDLVVPTRNMTSVNAADAGKAFKLDLAELGLRVGAGEHRDRGGHDLRSWYETRAIEDGADSLILRRTTHAAPKDVAGGYERFSWKVICREVAKLQIGLLDGEILTLATGFATAERKAENRWRKVVTPMGLEPMFSA